MKEISSINFKEALKRIKNGVKRTPLVNFASGHPQINLKLKLECLQKTKSFKARGALNQVLQLNDRQRKIGVVATSSGNHGKALSWAANKLNIPAIICMEKKAYKNKIEACKKYGSKVFLGDSRKDAEEECSKLVENGFTLIHPYNSAKTIEGAGTIGIEIAEQWPEVEVVCVASGGGGSISGISMALKQELGEKIKILGVEPKGSPNLTKGIEADGEFFLKKINTDIQGLCPLSTGKINVEICKKTVEKIILLEDNLIFHAQKKLMDVGKWIVEPAGAGAVAPILNNMFPKKWLKGRKKINVVAIVSGGNAEINQIKNLV